MGPLFSILRRSVPLARPVPAAVKYKRPDGDRRASIMNELSLIHFHDGKLYRQPTKMAPQTLKAPPPTMHF